MQAAAIPAIIGLNAASSLASGIAGYQQARGEKERAQANAHIGRTRAIQTNVAARESMNDDLATLRATFAANQQKAGVGTMEVFDELRSVRNRDRRIEFGNRMAEAADYRMQARNAAAAGRNSLFGGILGMRQSLFDMADYRREKRLGYDPGITIGDMFGR